MLKALLVDDEQHCTESLAMMIAAVCPQVAIVDQVHTAKEAIRVIRATAPDLLFLDVNMPNLSGLDLVEALGESSPAIIFTTAHDQFAVEAFRVGAVDYLLKPIRQKELVKAVDRAERSIHKGISRENTPNRLLQKMAIPNQDGISFVEIENIIFCQSESNYTRVETLEGTHLMSKTLKEVETQLSPHTFLRVHNSYLINLQQIASYVRGNGGYLVMKGNHHVPVSRSRKQALLEAIGQ